MSRRTSVKRDHNVLVRFSSWVKMLIDIVAPKNLFFVGGRGTAKTTDIIAERSMVISKAMPGAYFGLVVNTYENLRKNVLPALLEGWERKGWKEGYDYVVDKPPPSHFDLPYKSPKSYKNSISTRFGNFFVFISLKEPTSAAGNSYQHIFGDEAKYLDFEKLKKLMPALRGYPQFGHSIYYRGMTFATDMPKIHEGDFDWILDKEKDMDVDQIKLALKAGIVVNEINKELINAIRDQNSKVQKLQKQLIRWNEKKYQARQKSTLFYMVSSFANADILTPGYFEDALDALGPEEFKSAILTLTPTLKDGEKFYPSLGAHHFLIDGVNRSYYEKYPSEKLKGSSLALKYIAHDKPLNCGVDFGDMCSLFVGQEIGSYSYPQRFFHTLPPSGSKQLAKKFTDFYKHHKKKVLHMYYDRSGNQYSKIKRDWASEVKKYIEIQDGVKTGWTVILMSKKQATILQEQEYRLMDMILSESNPKLPKVRMELYGCKEPKSSMELAKIEIKTGRNGTKSVHKNKTSESLPREKLPMNSTNASDAVKYYYCRPDWLEVVAFKEEERMSAPTVV